MNRETTQITLLLCLLASSALAQKTITNGNLTSDGARALEIRSVFDPLPPSGYAPLRIVATNGTDGDMRWDFSFLSKTQQFRRENEHRSRLALAVPAHSTQSATFLAPLSVNYGDTSSGYWNNNHQLHVSVDVPGLSTKSFQDYANRADDFPAIAISKGLADANHSKLKDEIERRTKSGSRGGGSSNFFGSAFSPADLPEDWRGLSGFDFLMISSSEWQSLKPGQQLAVMQWVRFHGELHIYATAGITPAGLGLPQGFESDQKEISLGVIKLIRWDSKSLDAGVTVGRYYGTQTRAQDITAGYSGLSTGSIRKPVWELLNALGERNFASWQVVAFLVVFGILVGPVNLFVLAPSGRRHRLFITTPLLSVGASVLMVGIILTQDGTGGMGARLIAIDLQPEEAAAYVTQEQVSRTGVLLGGGFEVKQPALIEPLALPDTPWVKLKSNNNSQPAQLSQEGSLRGGNYFQSRAEQGQILRAVVSSRARLEMKTGLAADADPEVISALGFSIDDLFYVNANGGVWRAKGALATGQQVKLTKSDSSTLRSTLEAPIKLSGGHTRSRLMGLINGTLPRSTFFAIAKAAPGFAIDTLPSIRWQQDRVVVFGSLAQP
jgi:hypothetical protein